MSLLEQIEQLKGKRGVTAIGKLLDRAVVMIDKKAPKESRPALKKAVANVRKHAPELAHLAGGQLVALVAYLGVGTDHEAKRLYINPFLSVMELRRISQASTAALVRDTVDREKAWDGIKDMLNGLGKVLVDLLPILMAVA